MVGAPLPAPAVFRRWARRGLRWAGALALAALLLATLAALLLRLWLLPQAAHYRPQISQALSGLLAAPVEIGAVHAEWTGWRPFLALADVRIGSAEKPLLTLAEMRAWLGWKSLLGRGVRFSRLEMRAARLRVRRDGDGVLHVLGQRLDPRSADGEAGWQTWLAAQGEIILARAHLDWRDEYVAAGEAAITLALPEVNLRLLGGQTNWRFGLQAPLPAALGRSLDLRGQWSAAQQAARLYVRVDGGQWPALARTLRPWAGAALDATALHAGNGDLALWLDWQGQRLTHIRSRFALSQLRLQHSSGAASGRLEAERLHGWLHWPQGAGALNWRGHIGVHRLRLHHRGADVVRGLSGTLGQDAAAGAFDLRWHEGQIGWPETLPANDDRIALTRARLQGRWHGSADGGQTLAVDRFDLANADIQLHGKGEVGLRASGQPWRAQFEIGQRGSFDIAAVRRYLPRHMRPQAQQWLSECLLGGEGSKARIEFDGAFADFPFLQREDGLFRINVQAHNARLCPQTDWPELHSIDGRVRFQGASMVIDQARGKIYDTALDNVTVSIADLQADAPVLRVDGQAQGETADFLRFVANSPLRDKAGSLIDSLQAEGRASLTLALGLVLEPDAPDAIDGEVRLQDNRLVLLPALPAFEAVNGVLRFDADALDIPRLNARWLGAPVQASARGSGGALHFSGTGGVQASTFAAWLQQHCAACGGVGDSLGGNARLNFKGQLDGDDNLDFSLRSDLKAFTSALPAPLNKSATTSWPLRLRLEQRQHRRLLALSLDERASGYLRWQRDEDSQSLRLASGFLALADERAALEAQQAQAPSDGYWLGLRMTDELDLDAWRALFHGNGNGIRNAATALPPWQAQLQAARFRIWQNEGHNLDLRLEAQPRHWQGHLASSLAEGTFSWRNDRDSDAHGALRARFKHLALGRPDSAADERVETSAAAPEAIIPHQPEQHPLPAIDLVADRFVWRGQAQGRLEIQAHNQPHAWRLHSLSLLGEDGQLQLQGQWPRKLPSQSEISFHADFNNLGAALTRLNYDGVIDRGRATANGHLRWPGAPQQFSSALLSGALSFQAENGQFLKIKPGAGRLLGLLSLQSLGRRLEGDFRDLIEEGFVFEKISGELGIENGLMRSDNIHIKGASAQAWLGGKADLAEKTQELIVIVQPSLSDSVTVGALATSLVNPAVGIVTYLAQKILQNPLDKMFAFGYHIRGHWSQPHIEALTPGHTPGHTPPPPGK